MSSKADYPQHVLLDDGYVLERKSMSWPHEDAVAYGLTRIMADGPLLDLEIEIDETPKGQLMFVANVRKTHLMHTFFNWFEEKLLAKWANDLLAQLRVEGKLVDNV